LSSNLCLLAAVARGRGGGENTSAVGSYSNVIRMNETTDDLGVSSRTCSAGHPTQAVAQVMCLFFEILPDIGPVLDR